MKPMKVCALPSRPNLPREVAGARDARHAGPAAPPAEGLCGTDAPLEAEIRWRAARSTYFVPQYLMFRPALPGVDHLHGRDGACARYDAAFGRQSRAEQLTRHTRSILDLLGDGTWAGFCNHSAEVACLLDRPRNTVRVDGVSFSPDILLGLLTLVSADLVERREVIGTPKRGADARSRRAPRPHELHERVFRGWGERLRAPFILDIRPDRRVLNIPFDAGRVTPRATPPRDFEGRAVPRGGRVRFYRAELTSTGFPKARRVWDYWIHTSDLGTRTSGWIEGPATSPPPGVAWRPEGLRPWVGPARLNGQIRLEEVKRLYDLALTPLGDSGPGR